MKKILITGGGGYIGSIGINMFLQKGYEVITLDNFSTGFRQPLELVQNKFGKNMFRYYECDLREKDCLLRIFKKEKNIQTVLHCANVSIVNESMIQPQKYFNNNIIGTYNLLETMILFNVKNLVFSSTCAVYKTTNKIVDETSPIYPESPYGESKLIIENTILWYSKLIGLKHIIFRYFNVCGASEDGEFGDSKKPSTALIQNAIKGALGIEQFYLTYARCNTYDKSPIRDFINVVDLNEAHYKAVQYLLKDGQSDIINLGTGTGNSVLEIVNKVKLLTRSNFPIKKALERKGEHPIMIASIKKAENILGWKPKKTIEDSVLSLIKWYKKYPNGWRK